MSEAGYVVAFALAHAVGWALLSGVRMFDRRQWVFAARDDVVKEATPAEQVRRMDLSFVSQLTCGRMGRSP